MSPGRLVAGVLVIAGCRAATSTPTPTKDSSEHAARTDARMDLGAATEVPADTRAQEVRGFAVAELFTSEGCSSCPPADAVLADLAGANRSPDAPVYALAFHVDYWNDLGWTDAFSSAEFTDRQRTYARAFGLAGVYTPQLVVNGVEQFTGSDRERARATIGEAVATPGSARLTLLAELRGDAAVEVRYRVAGAPPDSVLHLALVDRSEVTRVRAGENAGKVLRHVNLVRAFSTVTADLGEGARSLPLVRRSQAEPLEVVGYVQRTVLDARGGLAIVAAARVVL